MLYDDWSNNVILGFMISVMFVVFLLLELIVLFELIVVFYVSVLLLLIILVLLLLVLLLLFPNKVGLIHVFPYSVKTNPGGHFLHEPSIILNGAAHIQLLPVESTFKLLSHYKHLVAD
jgi:hypothetical protein